MFRVRPAQFPTQSKVNLLKAVGGAVPQWTAHLAKNQFGVRDSTVLADFIEADYPGYASAPTGMFVSQSNFLPPHFFEIEGIAQTGPGFFFGTNNTGPAQTVYALYVTFPDDASIERLLFCGNIWDTHGEWTNTPDGYTIHTGSRLYRVQLNITLCDFFR